MTEEQATYTPEHAKIRLTKTERRPILSMAREKQEIADEANRQLAELDAAMAEMVTLLSERRQLSGDWTVRQEGADLFLVRRPDPPTE